MTTNIKKSKLEEKNNRLLFSKWLLLIVSVAILGAGCANMKSVRNGYGQYTPDKNQLENKNPDVASAAIAKKTLGASTDSETTGIDEFEKKLLQNNPRLLKESDRIEMPDMQNEDENDEPVVNDNSTNITGIPPANRLPTLREQMFLLNKKQNELAEKIDTMDSDIEGVKNDIKEIKNILKNNDETNKLINATNIKSNNIKSDSKQSGNKGSFLLVSDQKAKEKTLAKSHSKLNKEQIEKQAIKETFMEGIEPKNEAKIRTEEDTKPQVPVDLNDAITTFKNKEYGLAVNKFKAIIQNGKAGVNENEIDYYIGESYYGLKDYKSALDYFDKIIKSKSTNRKPESQMRIAEINMVSGNAREARSAYETLILNFPKSDYVPKARKMLQQL